MKAEIIPTKMWLPQDGNRTPGIHVSHIIRAIAIETGILKDEILEEIGLMDITEGMGQSREFDLLSTLRMAVGTAFDEYYIPRILAPQGIVPHPGEMEVDGIYMTLDGESVSMILQDYHSVVHEVKTTYKSTNTVKNLESQIMWLMQIKAYCKALRTRFACLHVMFLCGDYSRPIRPRLGLYDDRPTVWMIEFTQKEIDDNWNLIREYRDQKVKNG